MTDTLIRMTYLGDGISTDDEDVGQEEEEKTSFPSPEEEGLPENDGDFSEASEE